jgi:hypothetical protein
MRSVKRLGAVAAIGAAMFFYWFGAEPPLRPPGWLCEEVSDGYTRCSAAPGWHFEEIPGVGRAAIHDITRTRADRQRDIDLASGWRHLDNDQRRAILGGKASIYDFLDFEQVDEEVDQK